MKKITLATHWSAQEVDDSLLFLADLRQRMAHSYAEELDELYRQTTIERGYDALAIEDDAIPF